MSRLRQTEWDEVQKLWQQDGARSTFLNEVIVAVQKGKLFNSAFFKAVEVTVTRSIAKTDEDKTKKGWRSYKFHCDMEGQEITDDLMRTKGVNFVKDPRLGPDSQVPYPKNQVLWWTQGSIVSGTLIKTQVDEKKTTR